MSSAASTYKDCESTAVPGLQAIAMEPFGVEVVGDLAQPLSAEAGRFLQALLDQHSLILARGQSLTLDQHQELMRTFGPVLENDYSYVEAGDAVLGSGALAFHSDISFAPTPYTALSLHALAVVDGETSTRFASSVRAYQHLSPELRKRLAALTTTAVSTAAITRTIGYDVPASAHRFDRSAIVAHPRTGVPILYLSEAHTARFNELERAESDTLLQQLFAVLYAPDAVFEHPWSVGDLVMWDNFALQHGRPDLHKVTSRRLQRVTVAERALFDMIPNFVPGDPK